MTRFPLWICVLGFSAACNRPAEGTFVGNPNLTAGYSDNEVQRGLGGRLEAEEVRLLGCVGEDDVSLNDHAFTFDGTDSPDFLQLPQGSFCGVRVVVRELAVRFDEGGPESTTVIGSGFEVVVHDKLRAREGQLYRLSLANAAWLQLLADATEPGENIADAANPDLVDAFYVPLQEESGLEELTDPGPEDELPGRLNLEGYPQSPDGTPSSQSGCGPSVQFDMAVPIPHAAMANLGIGSGEVGWCQGGIQFSADLAPNTSIQLDYSDFSTYPVQYNGWGQGCAALHCNEVVDFQGAPMGIPCTVLAFCDAGNNAVVTGYSW